MKNILVTGAAGFIGFHISKRLIENKINVIGIDNLNEYYDPQLKRKRLIQLKTKSRECGNNFIIYKTSIENSKSLKNIFEKYKPDIVINLAAQAGVRYSLKNPRSYINSNIVGFGNILENCKDYDVKHLIFASSSSVYGGNNQFPYKEDQNVDHPISIYAVSKRSNELMAHSYSHLYSLHCTGLRFFTVYGPWGRPDMALYKFTDSILKNKEIHIFNKGIMQRDFTYIDDITESIYRLIDKPPNKNNSYEMSQKDPSSSWCPYSIFNIGNSSSIKLLDFISILEEELNVKAQKIFDEMQSGDVLSTYSDCSKLEKWINFKPKTTLSKGIKEFIKWYKEYYKYN